MSRLRFVFLAAGFALAGARPLPAQMNLPGFPPGKWWKDRAIVEDLHLNADQQGRIESIWMENRRRLIDLKADLDRKQLDLGDALGQSTVDEAAAVKAFEAVQMARLAIEKTTFSMRVRTKNVLSAEQQQKLEEIAERTRRERQARK
jgi:Spy/CpxP family protein refolding chaperone